MAGAPVLAEDADRFRSYLHWRSYEWDTIWGVDDGHGISLGANLDRHWGVELGLDSYQLLLRNAAESRVAELSAQTFLAQVRYRQPLLRDRLVPYLLLGAGGSFQQFNDRKSAGFGVDIEAEDWRFAFAGGVGIEYFLDDEIAFGFEGKYLFTDPLKTRIGGVSGERDMSAFLLSFGLRMYFDENHRRPFADLPTRPSASRFYFGVRAGADVIVDGDWGGGIELKPLAGAPGDALNKHFGVTLGLNLNRNWAVEVAVDGGQSTLLVDERYAIGEYTQAGIMPQVRYRQPLNGGRAVPYLLAGGGFVFAEFNDAKPDSVRFPVIDAEGFYPGIRVGGGLEYFMTRNFSLGLEANYQYSWDHEIRLSGRPEVSGDLAVFQAFAMFRVYLFDL